MFTRTMTVILCLGCFIVPINADEPPKYKPIESAKATDAGLKELKDLNNLTSLSLGGTQVTDAGLKELKEALPKCWIYR